MSDLISRQAVIDAVIKYCLAYDLRDLLADIETIPSEVRHGKWIKYVSPINEDDGQEAWDCSECAAMVMKPYAFCPRCGARMDG